MEASVVPLAYLWQHTWQVGGTVFGVTVIAWMAYALVRGEIPESGWSASTSRAFALGGLLLGAGVVIAAWTVNAEPPCGNCNRDRWGGAAGIVVLAVWVGGMLAITAHNVRRAGDCIATDSSHDIDDLALSCGRPASAAGEVALGR